MANTFQVSQIVAREGLYILRNMLSMGATVYRALDAEFESQIRKVGDTITVRKPPTLVARDVTDDLAGDGLQTQDVTETSASVTLDKHKYVRVVVTSKEATLKLQDLREQVIMPQIVPLVEQLEADLFSLYKDVPYYAGAAGDTPDSLDDIANCGKVLSTNKAPQNPRFMQIDPAAQAKFWPLLANLKTPAFAENDALTQAAVGRTGNFNIYENQQVAYHTKGTLDAGATATGASGATTITIAAGGNAKTLLKGDLLTIATVTKTDGSLYQFVVTADATTAADGTGTANIYPALPANVAAKAITVVGSHRANLAYTRMAFCLAMAKQDLPMGGARGEYVIDPESKLALRAIYDWESGSLSNVVHLDMLYGVKTLRQEEACILLG